MFRPYGAEECRAARGQSGIGGSVGMRPTGRLRKGLAASDGSPKT